MIHPAASILTLLAFLTALLGAASLPAANADDALRKAVTFYASFDDDVKAEVAGGAKTLSTRTNHPTEKGHFVFTQGFDAKVFRIAKGKGISGGALEVVDVLPSNGRVFFPLKGNLVFKPGGWGGAVSC